MKEAQNEAGVFMFRHGVVDEAIGTPMDRGYIYFAIAFFLVVQFLNIKMRKRMSKKTAAA